MAARDPRDAAVLPARGEDTERVSPEAAFSGYRLVWPFLLPGRIALEGVS